MNPTAEAAFTQSVIERLKDCEDPRFKSIMNSLVTHLHAFARDVRLTDDEWMCGLQFLTEVGKACTETRQEFILLSDTLGLSSLVLEINHPPLEGTLEAAVLGPFYLEGSPERPLGADLTDGMPGEPTFYSGQVGDASGVPIPGATLDIWSSDGVGFYDVQFPGPLVKRGRAKIKTDASGRYHFRSIKPADYPVPTDGPVGRMMRYQKRSPQRPGHLHLIVSAPGFAPVVTQIFVADSKYLHDDAVFGVKQSLAGQFSRHPAGTAPNGEPVPVPFYTVNFDMRLLRAS
ncbi:MAG: hydroxyquinol 1,2-dioxygenase [Gammaproteobacteria bacterium]|nr:hydroxyquinol 1,2-dioxygenase [Gammaproteobacteria bacterium]